MAEPSDPSSREVLVAAAGERFNVGLLAALLVVGAVLGTVSLMVPLAVLVYAVAVGRSYLDPATTERVRAARRAEGRKHG